MPRHAAPRVRRDRPRWIHLIAAVLAVVALIVGGASAASATTHGRSHRHDTDAACPALDVSRPGQYMWVDEGSEKSPLATHMTQLICSAAPHSTVEVKMWFMNDGGYQADRFFAALQWVHQHRHVRVLINLDVAIMREFHLLHVAHTVLPTFASVTMCSHGCVWHSSDSADHSKWITVSRMIQGGSGSLITSLNVSSSMYEDKQSGVFFYRVDPVTRELESHFALYARCAKLGCPRTLTSRGWFTAGPVQMYFTPTSADDPAKQFVQDAACGRGGTIELSSLFLQRGGLINALVAAHRAGCTVRILSQHAPDKEVAQNSVLRCTRQHDKFMVVEANGHARVLFGTEDFTAQSLRRNDNVMVLSHSPSVVAHYLLHFAVDFRHAGACT